MASSQSPPKKPVSNEEKIGMGVVGILVLVSIILITSGGKKTPLPTPAPTKKPKDKDTDPDPNLPGGPDPDTDEPPTTGEPAKLLDFTSWRSLMVFISIAVFWGTWLLMRLLPTEADGSVTGFHMMGTLLMIGSLVLGIFYLYSYKYDSTTWLIFGVSMIVVPVLRIMYRFRNGAGTLVMLPYRTGFWTIENITNIFMFKGKKKLTKKELTLKGINKRVATKLKKQGKIKKKQIEATEKAYQKRLKGGRKALRKGGEAAYGGLRMKLAGIGTQTDYEAAAKEQAGKNEKFE